MFLYLFQFKKKLKYNIHNRFKMNLSMETKYEICGCCDDSLTILMDKPLKEQLDGTTNPGIKNLLENKSLDTINEDGRYIVEWCVDYLIFLIDNDPPGYFTIWRFVCEFFNIKSDSGYDYYIMSWLEWNDIMEHGSAIRCGNFKDWGFENEKYITNPYIHKIHWKLTPERKQEIEIWYSNLPLKWN